MFVALRAESTLEDDCDTEFELVLSAERAASILEDEFESERLDV